MRRGWVAALATSVAVLAAPVAVVAQPVSPMSKIPHLGLLRNGSPPGGNSEEAFRRGLRELGYVEGQTILLEWRWAEGRPERLPGLAAELVRLPADVIVTSGPDAIRAAQRATGTIPIVAAVMHEPVAFGFVARLARPGGNITGLSFQDSDLSTKRLDLLKEMLPRLSHVAALWDPVGGGELARRAAEEAARSLGLKLQVLEIRRPEDLAGAFDAARKGRAQALIQLSSPFFSSHRRAIGDLAIKGRLPTTCEQAQFVDAGCLMAYGPSFDDMFRRAASYVDRILKGARPADLPVEQPTKFELTVNAKTAKAVGLTIPQSLLLRADRLIE